MNPRNATVVALVLTLVVGLVAPAATTATAASEDLSVGVTQDTETGEATVTVTRNDTAVENATVAVESVGPYAGNGTYETGANGTVTLPAPNSTVEVTLTATDGSAATSRTVELVPLDESLSVTVDQDESGTAVVAVTQYDEPVENATVEVTTVGNTSYAGNGTYETDADGTVTLPAPDENRTVEVTATAGNLTARTTVDLAAALDVTVEQADDGTATVTVTRNNVSAENATVDVTTVGNASYAGTGTHETDANGTVSLPAPDEDVTVEVTATADGLAGQTTADLEAPFKLTVEQADDGTATVTVTRGGTPVTNATVDVTTVGNASYAGNGTYETDANGTVSLPAPEEEVEVTVTATAGNDTAETTITLYTAQESGAFGQAVSDFVHDLLGSGERGIGHEVSTFATSNNPGDGQGPPDHAGPPDSDDEDDASAEEEDEGNEEEDEGNEEEDETDEEEDETDEDATDTEDDADEETSDDEADERRGEGASDDEADEKEEEDDDDDDASDNGNGNGPPDHAGK